MKKIALGTIRAYQRWISPGLGLACRFQPTCSEYAYQAIDRFGVVRGMGMGAWRIVRCTPFNKGGFDPVPEAAQRRQSQA